MIDIEYVNGQYQDGNTSVAIKSQRRLGHNPQLHIQRNANLIKWEITGLVQGTTDTVTGGRPRKPRLDFYIGLNHAINQRTTFPVSTGVISTALPTTNSVGTERPGGINVKMVDVIGRTLIEDVKIVIPPYDLSKKGNSHLFLNVDIETAWYGIKDHGGKITKAEIHFGVKHDFLVNRTTQPISAVLWMNENQYATVLSFIDDAILLFNRVYRSYL